MSKANGVTKADKVFIAKLADTHRALDTDLANIKSLKCWRQGSFTVVKVELKNGRQVEELVGVSKLDCNVDSDVPGRGREIALARALRGEAEEV